MNNNKALIKSINNFLSNKSSTGNYKHINKRNISKN